jgi:hypothetical protein
MLKLFKISCLFSRPGRSSVKGIGENDVEMFEQWIFPQNIVAICPLREEDRLPNAECLIVIAGGNNFQTTETINDLIDRINKAVEE